MSSPLRINLSIGEGKLQKLADLPFVRQHVEADKIAISRGKIRSKDFTIRHRLSPVRGWYLWCRPEHPSVRSIRLALGVDFGLFAVGDLDKAVRFLYDRLKAWLPKLPVNIEGEGLTIDTDPVKVLRVEAEDGRIEIEVSI